MCGISLKHKIIFLSNHKCGSTSIQKCLQKNNIIDLKFNQFPNKTNLPKNIKHSFYQDLIKNISFKVIKNILDYDIVVFTRNPIKRMISLYFYNSALINKYKNVEKSLNNDINISLSKMIKKDGYKFNRFIYKSNGEKISNKMKIFKLENIDEFYTYLKRKKVKFKRNVDRKNKSKKKHVELTQQTKKLIIEYFRHEIKNHYPKLMNNL